MEHTFSLTSVSVCKNPPPPLISFEVLRSDSVKMAVFWVYGLTEVYRRYCLHHQGDDCPDDGDSSYL